jgi:hypothetical protein
MRPILTPDNPQSTMVFVHVDPGTCVRHVARYIGDLHLRLPDITEHASEAFVRVDHQDPDNEEPAEAACPHPTIAAHQPSDRVSALIDGFITETGLVFQPQPP